MMDLKNNQKSILAVLVIFTMLLSMSLAIAKESSLTKGDDDFDKAKAILKYTLKDPDSAKFRNLSVVKNSVGDSSVCGEYNARNSYGGYVGFEPFAIVGELLSVTEITELERLGCFGLEAELNRRQKDAAQAMSENFKREAEFSCNVIWMMLDNHFRQKESIDSVLNAAIHASKNRALENGVDIQPQVLEMIRDQYRAALVNTSKEKQQVKSIRKNDTAFKLQFLSSCKMQTVVAMESAAR